MTRFSFALVAALGLATLAHATAPTAITTSVTPAVATCQCAEGKKPCAAMQAGQPCTCTNHAETCGNAQPAAETTTPATAQPEAKHSH